MPKNKSNRGPSFKDWIYGAYFFIILHYINHKLFDRKYRKTRSNRGPSFKGGIYGVYFFIILHHINHKLFDRKCRKTRSNRGPSFKSGFYTVYADVSFYRGWLDTQFTNNGGASFTPWSSSRGGGSILHPLIIKQERRIQCIQSILFN